MIELVLVLVKLSCTLNVAHVTKPLFYIQSTVSVTSNEHLRRIIVTLFHNVSSERQGQGPHGLCINSSVQVSTQKTAFGRQFIPSTLVPH